MTDKVKAHPKKLPKSINFCNTDEKDFEADDESDEMEDDGPYPEPKGNSSSFCSDSEDDEESSFKEENYK